MAKLGAVLITALAALLVGSCASLGELIALGDRIEEAGYQNVSVNHSTTTNGDDSLVIAAATPQRAAAEYDAERIARLVWETYPQDVDTLQVALNGQLMLAATSDQLEERFGPRDPALVPDQGGGGWSIIVVIVLAVFAVVVILIVTAIKIRHRRLRRQLVDPPYPQPPHG